MEYKYRLDKEYVIYFYISKKDPNVRVVLLKVFEEIYKRLKKNGKKDALSFYYNKVVFDDEFDLVYPSIRHRAV